MKKKQILIVVMAVTAMVVGSVVLPIREYQRQSESRRYQWHVYGTVYDIKTNLLDGVDITVLTRGPVPMLGRLREKSLPLESRLHKQTDSSGSFDFRFEATDFVVGVYKDGFEDQTLTFGRVGRRHDDLDQKLIIILKKTKEVTH